MISLIRENKLKELYKNDLSKRGGGIKINKITNKLVLLRKY